MCREAIEGALGACPPEVRGATAATVRRAETGYRRNAVNERSSDSSRGALARPAREQHGAQPHDVSVDGQPVDVPVDALAVPEVPRHARGQRPLRRAGVDVPTGRQVAAAERADTDGGRPRQMKQ